MINRYSIPSIVSGFQARKPSEIFTWVNSSEMKKCPFHSYGLTGMLLVFPWFMDRKMTLVVSYPSFFHHCAVMNSVGPPVSPVSKPPTSRMCHCMPSAWSLHLFSTDVHPHSAACTLLLLNSLLIMWNFWNNNRTFGFDQGSPYWPYSSWKVWRFLP